jgi:hypothetical protein
MKDLEVIVKNGIGTQIETGKEIGSERENANGNERETGSEKGNVAKESTTRATASVNDENQITTAVAVVAETLSARESCCKQDGKKVTVFQRSILLVSLRACLSLRFSTESNCTIS